MNFGMKWTSSTAVCINKEWLFAVLCEVIASGKTHFEVYVAVVIKLIVGPIAWSVYRTPYPKEDSRLQITYVCMD